MRSINLVCTLLALGGCRAVAVAPQASLRVPSNSGPIVRESRADESAWMFTLKPYLWAAGLHGDMQLGTLPPVEVDLGFSQIIEDLDFTLMVGFEARKGDSDWALLFDLMYVGLEEEGQISEVEVGQTVIEASVTYRPGEQEVFELLGGLRYWQTDLDIDILGVDADRGSKSWIDPVIGGRADLDLAGAWSIQLLGDVGGFGVGSEFTYQARAAVRYAFTARGHLEVGYRHLYFDYDEEGFRYDAALTGPLLGLTWSF